MEVGDVCMCYNGLGSKARLIIITKAEYEKIKRYETFTNDGLNSLTESLHTLYTLHAM